MDNDVSFSSADHSSTRAECISAMRDRKAAENEMKLSRILSSVDADTARTLKRGKECGQWLSCVPSDVNGTELSAEEFRTNLHLRYARTPGDLPKKCDGCGARFTIQHSLQCKTGGLVIIRHDEVANELMDLAQKALSKSAVRVEPLIHTDSAETSKIVAQEPESGTQSDDNQPSNHSENDGKRGDVLVRGLFQNGMHSVIDVRVTDLDSASYKRTAPEKVLARQEKEKKTKYLEPCLQQRKSFVPFVVSTDGMLSYEAQNLVRRSSRTLAGKWEMPYSQVCNLVRTRLSIAIARATTLCVRGSRVPASRISRRIQWEDGAGVGLLETDY